MKKMKKIVSLALLVSLAITCFAQSDKYMSAMKANISMLDSVMIKNNSAELANNFDRIANAEKSQWLPYYYAAYATILGGYSSADHANNYAIADKAEQLINKADSLLGKENSETAVIKSMIATAHMMQDPQSRYMTYGAASNDYIEQAKSLDPTNPRPVLLEAQSKFYTPEQFGGGKAVAKEYFDKAKMLNDNFKPENELSPKWGNSALQYFLSQYK